MILSNLEIQRAIDEGRIIIDPQPLPRKKNADEYCPYDTCAVDLTLGAEISVPKGGPFTIDLTRRGGLAEFIHKHCDPYKITEEQPFLLERGKFILAKTFERIGLPVGKFRPYLAARIEGKSSAARCGILVHFTAPTVHTCWDGPLTLEMTNLGPASFTLKPRMPIAQLIIEEVHGDIMENPSQFQGQITPEGTGPKRG